MPNHPGFIDPPLVLSYVRIGQPVRPVVTASMYRMPVLYPFMRLVGALEVPDLSEQSRGARDRTLAMIDAVVAGLHRGESFLIYPAGRARRGPLEVVGAARAVHEILERFPTATIVLVRTQGVWGSMFSYARTGKAPSLAKCLLRGAGWILANLVFSGTVGLSTGLAHVMEKTGAIGWIKRHWRNQLRQKDAESQD